MNPAEQMREAAAMAAWNVEGGDRWTRAAAQNAIRALPLPPAPPLADDVAGVVKMLRHGSTRPFVNDTAADLIERLARELAPVKAERDRFEAALSRACLVGGTTYLIERAEKAEAEVARLRDGHLEIIRQFGDTPNGHMAAEISRAALTPKGADHE